MGLKKLKKFVKRAAAPVVNTVKAIGQGDLKGAAKNAAIAMTGTGSLGAAAPAAITKYQEVMNAPLPGINYNQNIRDQQSGLINNQLSNYQSFNPEDYIQTQAGAYRRRLAEQVSQGQQGARANANARGMLFSGQRIKQEGDIARAGAQDYNQFAGNLISDTLQRQQALASDPLMAQANLNLANQQQSSALDRIKQQQQAARTGLMTAGFGAIGEGLGSGLGDRSNFQRKGY